MVFLPIVERELRVASRRRGTYWMRVVIAVGALVILISGCVFTILMGIPEDTVGPYVFRGLGGLLLLYCLFAGRGSTVDSLSEEKREGTLGLLFLTDLKGYDIVLGKMAATSLGAFYGLLSVFPLLAVPLLMGGTSSGEFWRLVLVLVDTFLFSLAVGIFSSAICRDYRKAAAINFVLILVPTLLLPACGALLTLLVPVPMPHPALFLASPVYPAILSVDILYLSPTIQAYFWWSVAIIHGLTWFFVLLACRIIPHAWQDKPIRPVEPIRRVGPHQIPRGDAAERATYRQRLLDINPFYWLAARNRFKPLWVWIFIGLMGCWWLFGWITAGRYWLHDSVKVTMAMILNSTLKLWIALEAGQCLAENLKSGALELLLSTPLTVREILRGQFLALRRQFIGPVLLVVALELLFLLGSCLSAWPGDRAAMFALWSGVILMLAADLAALFFVAIHQALIAKTVHLATRNTAGRVLFLPWIGVGIVVSIASLISGMNDTDPGWGVYLGSWFLLGIIADLAFGLAARRALLSHFRELATRRFSSAASRPAA